MDIVQPTTASVNWSTGFRLYADRKPITACANNAQRRGWLDGQCGERACIVIDTVFATGGNAEAADHVLAQGW